MIAPTHITFSFFFTLLGVTMLGYTMNMSIPAYLFGFLGAVLPDIDTPRSIIGRIFKPISSIIERKYGHRTITHSLLGWVVASIVTLPLLFWHKEYYFFFSLSYFSHLILDMFNQQGITLFWPDRKRDVIGKSVVRLPTGDKKELILMIVFICLSFLTLPFTQYGWKNAFGFLLGDHQSAEEIYLRSDKRSYLDFRGVISDTRQAVSGKALILERYGEKGFYIGWNGKVYTIGNSGEVDILSKQERIDYTDQVEDRIKQNYEASSYKQLLAKLPANSYFKGIIIVPDNNEIKIPINLGKRIQYKDGQINIIQAVLPELKSIIVTPIASREETYARNDLNKTLSNFEKVKAELYNDGLTELGRKKLNIDYTKNPNYIDAKNQVVQARNELYKVIFQNSSGEWKGEIECRRY
jgi:inner membrane protein